MTLRRRSLGTVLPTPSADVQGNDQSSHPRRKSLDTLPTLMKPHPQAIVKRVAPQPSSNPIKNHEGHRKRSIQAENNIRNKSDFSVIAAHHDRPEPHQSRHSHDHTGQKKNYEKIGVNESPEWQSALINMNVEDLAGGDLSTFVTVRKSAELDLPTVLQNSRTARSSTPGTSHL
jgi:hypothetical protein